VLELGCSSAREVSGLPAEAKLCCASVGSVLGSTTWLHTPEGGHINA